MKNNLLPVVITALLAGAITFFATKQHYSGMVKSGNPIGDTTLQPGFNLSVNSHAYPIDSATADVDTLQSIAAMVNSQLGNRLPAGMGLGVVAYTISAFDLLGALGLDPAKVAPPLKFIRVYMGFNTTTGFKLFIASVDTSALVSNSCCGRDLFYDTVSNINGGLKIVRSPAGTGGFVLDLISPCPTTCDTSSHLVQDILGQVSCASCLTLGSQPTKK